MQNEPNYLCFGAVSGDREEKRSQTNPIGAGWVERPVGADLFMQNKANYRRFGPWNEDWARKTKPIQSQFGPAGCDSGFGGLVLGAAGAFGYNVTR